MFYCKISLEWINMKNVFFEIFIFLSIPHVIHALLKIMFIWSYHPNIFKYCYKPIKVFKEFEIHKILNLDELCICQSSKRFNKFFDNITLDGNNEEEGKGHVRTMDLFIIQHKGLKQVIQMDSTIYLWDPRSYMKRSKLYMIFSYKYIKY